MGIVYLAQDPAGRKSTFPAPGCSTTSRSVLPDPAREVDIPRVGVFRDVSISDT